MNWYFEVLNKYATFDGRAHREEYWMFFLLSALVGLLFLALDLALQLHSFVFNGIYTLVAFIPTIAVGVRRMHDTGRSGWWLVVTAANS